MEEACHIQFLQKRVKNLLFYFAYLNKSQAFSGKVP